MTGNAGSAGNGGTFSVAVIGAGRMGAAMVARLRGAGTAVIVYNRTRERARRVAEATGAAVADTAREAAAAAPVVLVSLADDRAVTSAYEGPDGVAAGVSPGAIVADTSTIDPHTALRIGELVAARGAGLLDAPVSGSVPSVERGELTVLAGGDPAHLERARPVLGILARQIFHVGPAGAGATMKLAVNSVVHALNQALSEALGLAERSGIRRDVAYDVLAASAAGAPFVHYKRAAFERPDETPVAFTLDLVAKDLDLVLGLAARVGAPMEQAAANRAAVAAAIEAGLGGRDMSAIAEFLRHQA